MTVIVKNGMTYTAVFEKDNFTVTAKGEVDDSPVSDSVGTVTGSGTFNGGEVATLTAAAKPGYRFVKWYHPVYGDDLYSGYIKTIAVTADTEFIAVFESSNPSSVKVTGELLDGRFNGRVGSIEGAGTYYEFDLMTLKATPKFGYAFIGWFDSDGDLMSSDRTFTAYASGDISLTARFGKVPVDDVYALLALVIIVIAGLAAASFLRRE